MSPGCHLVVAWLSPGCFTHTDFSTESSHFDTQQPTPTKSTKPCEYQSIVASGLSMCSHLNGAKVCANESALPELDARVENYVTKFREQGPACYLAMQQLQCQVMIPEMHPFHDHKQVRKVCFADCLRAWDLCGADRKSALGKCKQMGKLANTVLVVDLLPFIRLLH